MHVVVGIGDNPLATLFEIFQGIAQLLGCSGRVEGYSTIFQVDSLDIVVILRFADRGDKIVEPHLAHVGHTQESVNGRAFLAAFLNRTAEPNHKYGVVLDFCRSRVTSNHTDKGNNEKESRHN